MSIKIGIDLNTSDAENEIKKLSAEWEKSTLKVERQKQKIGELTNEIKDYNKFLELAKKAGQDISDDKWAKELQLRLKEANAQLKLLEANAYRAGKKLNEALSTGKESSPIKNIAKDTEGSIPKNISSENIGKNISKNIGNVTDKVKNAFGKLKEISGKFGETLKSKLSSVTQGFEKLGGFITRIGSRILKLASYAFVFTVISKGFRTIRSALADYIKTNSDLQSNLAQIKGNLITAFQPIWEFILPYLIKFTQILSQVTAYVSGFISALFGKTEQASRNNAKALHDQINASKEASKNLKKQKKSTDDLTKSNKKNMRSLASFDELSLLNKQSSSKSSKKSSKEDKKSVPAELSFETVKIDESKINGFINKIKDFFAPLKEPFNKLFSSLDRLKNYTLDAFKGFYDNFLKPLANYTVSEFLPHMINSIADSLDRMDFSTVNEGLNALWKELEPFTEHLANGILWLIDKFLLPLSEWTINVAVPEFLKSITKSVKVLNDIIEVFKPILDDLYNDVLIPIGEFLSSQFKKIMDVINNVLDDTSDLLKGNDEEIRNVSKAITDVLAIAIQILSFALEDIFAHVTRVLKLLTDFIFDAVNNIIKYFSAVVDFWVGIFTGDWERALKGFSNIFAAEMNAFLNILDLAISFITQTILSGINYALKIYNAIGGKFGAPYVAPIEIKKSYLSYRIPYLASGAVIPPNSPFLAMLGDQKSGVNIETPLETMKQAFKEALAESGSTNGGSYTFVAQLDGRTLFEETVRQNDMYVNQAGYSAF